ncbi:PilN domain-containing protein [Sporosarcina sp. ITBMC105]
MLVDINLLPEKERERSTLLLAALILIGAALLLWAVFFISSLQLAKSTTQVEGQIVELHARQEAIRERLQPTDTVSDRDQLAATVTWAESYQFATLPLLREMIALLPDRGFFVTFQFTAPNQATFAVQFDDKQDAAHYLTRIQASSLVNTSMIESLVAEELEEGDGKNENVLPRFLATYVVEFVDERGMVIETEDANPDLETEIEETDIEEVDGEVDADE